MTHPALSSSPPETNEAGPSSSTKSRNDSISGNICASPPTEAPNEVAEPAPSSSSPREEHSHFRFPFSSRRFHDAKSRISAKTHQMSLDSQRSSNREGGGGGPSDASNSRRPSNTSTDPLSSRGNSLSVGEGSHSRQPSREYKETLDAQTKDEKDGTRIINQYHLVRVIGQGSYGVVYEGRLQDDPSEIFAVKELSKDRLKKSKRQERLRRPPMRGRGGPSGPRSRGPSGSNEEPKENDPLELIRKEIAIMKKLDHDNVVSLVEALDDPSRDELYMVVDYCPDGPVIDVKIHQRTSPLNEQVARSYFIQILLGIEYLHHNDVIHRDIKPDNVLLCDQRKTCKIVDFGVSEMFTPDYGKDGKSGSKGQGTPAFLSPELCSAGSTNGNAGGMEDTAAWREQKETSGRRDDIWAFGVTFYCMVVGHLPFDKGHFMELYEAIKSEEPEYPAHLSAECVDLLQRFLNKDPNKRITIEEARKHPWVTQDQSVAIPSIKENLKRVVQEITEDDIRSAIAGISSLFTVARAVSKFKRARSRTSLRGASQSSDGVSSTIGSMLGGLTASPGPSSSKDWFHGHSSQSASLSMSRTNSETEGGQETQEMTASPEVSSSEQKGGSRRPSLADIVGRVSLRGGRRSSLDENEEDEPKAPTEQDDGQPPQQSSSDDSKQNDAVMATASPLAESPTTPSRPDRPTITTTPADEASTTNTPMARPASPASTIGTESVGSCVVASPTEEPQSFDDPAISEHQSKQNSRRPSPSVAVDSTEEEPTVEQMAEMTDPPEMTPLDKDSLVSPEAMEQDDQGVNIHTGRKDLPGTGSSGALNDEERVKKEEEEAKQREREREEKCLSPLPEEGEGHYGLGISPQEAAKETADAVIDSVKIDHKKEDEQTSEKKGEDESSREAGVNFEVQF